MKSLDRFETKGLFKVIRIISLLAILIAFLLIALSIGSYFTIKESNGVSLAEINSDTWKPKYIEADGTIRIPQDIFKKYFNDEKNNEIISGWLSGLMREEKENFISNLVGLIRDSEEKGKTITSEQINAYKSIKLRQINNEHFDKYFRSANRGAIILAVCILIGIIGMFSLVLVMLAIERNTRGNGVEIKNQ